MDTRREFLKKAALLTGTTGLWNTLPASIANALAIDPEPGSTYLDAEHIVILMQENRSFDHAFGTLQGVRGFNDPRAITLPNKNPVWLQTNAAGETYGPFRLNIKDTNATWMGSLPHSWTNQVDARNHGRHDKWLDAKPSGYRDYAKMPLTLGYYDREDIPFYYALADAFTVCDQHFCSSLTGTTPNRLYLWTGTIRETQDASSPANVLNDNVDYGSEVKWATFPERLEDHGISWKIYQNEISLDSGLQGEYDAWLSNFTDNPIEWFSQYNVRFAAGYRNYLEKTAQPLLPAIQALEKQVSTLPATSDDAKSLVKQIEEKKALLNRLTAERERWSAENFAKLSEREQNLHTKAFCNNSGDPSYRQLSTLTYRDSEAERQVQVPNGDVLHQFRQDVQNGSLPTVSWLVAPENFSDHPGAAWYGAWYVSEVLDILTHNPDIWKKTIFLLTYDENDGYFDHVPPFVAPHPSKPETGLVSKGIDTSAEYVMLEQELKRKPAHEARESSIGLGYRVPMVIASPWSRGGCVCSQVFDHTSVLQFMETFLTHKTGKKIEETNISGWRRTVCGDLTSAFQPYQGEKITYPPFLSRDTVIQGIHQAKFKKLPSGYKGLTREEIEQIKSAPGASPLLPRQEHGVRRSCALPYQLYADGALNPERTRFTLRFEARNEVFGKRSAGSPFNVYAFHGNAAHGDAFQGQAEMTMRAYAVAAGDSLVDSWAVSDFDNGVYHLKVHGPNGFLREFQGGGNDPSVEINVDYGRAKRNPKVLSGHLEIKLVNRDNRLSHVIEIRDNAYQGGVRKQALPPGGKATLVLDTSHSFGWYDFSVRVAESKPFATRYAGRVETGKWSYSDPAMGGVLHS
jgi:phospholipase C